MALDDMVLAEAEQARDRMETAQDAVEAARGDYHRAIRRLHAAGATLREIGEALGLSHQRVHQVVESGSMIEDRPAPKPAGTSTIHCTFCGMSQKSVKKLIAGPGVYICDTCIAAVPSAVAGRAAAADEARGITAVPPEAARVKCSFCGKTRKKVDWIAAAPEADVRICRECVDLCLAILEEEA